MKGVPGLKLVGYGAWFLAVFVMSLYVTFPIHVVKDRIVAEAEKALGKGKQGSYGVDPKVTIGSVGLWRLSGLELKHVSVQFGSKDPDPGAVLDVDVLRARVGLLSLLGTSKAVSFDADLYTGSATGAVTVDDKGNLLDAVLDLDAVDLGQAPAVVAKIGVPASGKLSAQVDLDLGPDPEKKAEGEITLDLKGVSVGPGELKLPLPGLTGGLTLPLVDLGNITGEVKVKQGQGVIEKLKADGKAIQAELSGTLGVRGKIQTSKVDADGWLRIVPEFLEENSKFKTLLEFPGPLQKARDDEGRYHFSLKGTLQAPNAALSRDAGKRSKAKPGAKPADPVVQ